MTTTYWLHSYSLLRNSREGNSLTLNAMTVTAMRLNVGLLVHEPAVEEHISDDVDDVNEAILWPVVVREYVGVALRRVDVLRPQVQQQRKPGP